MKNKKGFTLIELVVVVLILGILILIAVPTIQKFMNKGKASYYNSIENEIKRAGMDYAETYKTLLPKKIGNVVTIDLDEIVDNKYMDPVVDENGNKCTGYVTIKKVKADSYNYYSYLDCGDLYKSDELDISEDDNDYDDDTDYIIDIDDGLEELEKQGYIIDLNEKKVVVSQGKELKLPNAKVYDLEGNLIKDDLTPKPSHVDTGTLGIIKVLYKYRKSKKYLIVEVIDDTAPSKPEIILKYMDSDIKYDHKKGNNYRDDWFSGNIYAEFKSTDYVKKGMNGSGIKEYQISSDEINWTTVEMDLSRLIGKTVMTDEGNYWTFVRSIDNEGNVSESNKFNVKIDKTKPKCELEVKTGTKYKEWYNTDITIGFKYTDGTVSNIASQDIDITSITNPIYHQTITGTVYDQAKNKTICTIVVNVDNKKPTITTPVNTYIWWGTNKDILNYYTIGYNLSGVTTTCKLGDTVITNVNQLALGVNSVRCDVITGAGLEANATTTFRHQYPGTPHCSSGRTLSGSNCQYWHDNDSRCGCDTYRSCRNSACGTEQVGTKFWCVSKGGNCSSPEVHAHCDYVTRCKDQTFVSRGGSCAGHGGVDIELAGDCGCAKNNGQSGNGGDQDRLWCPVYGNKACRTAACGCEVYKSCWITENEYRYYQCESLGNNGTYGTLNGSTCSF